MRDSAPQHPQTSRIALGGLLLVSVLLVLDTSRTWALTTGAVLGWRLRLLIPDVSVGLVLILGCALAAFAAPRIQRLGWTLVGLTLLGVVGWTLVTALG